MSTATVAPAPGPARPRRRVPGMLLAALLAACGGDPAGPAGPGRSGAAGAVGTPSGAAGTALDPAVVAALSRRPDLARTKVIVIGIDGCDPRRIVQMTDAGELPNFRRIREEGAFGPLRSHQPMLSPILWTSIATGKFLSEHGVYDFTAPSEDAPGRRESVTARHRQVEAVWDIAGRYGRRVGVVGWLASHPAEAVNGFMVSERVEMLAYLFHQRVSPSPEGKTYPPALLPQVERLRREPGDVRHEEIARYLTISPREYEATFAKVFTPENRVNNLRLIHAATDNFRRIGRTLYADRRPDLFLTYFESIDATAHFFQCYEEPITWKPRPAAEIAADYGLDVAAVEKARAVVAEGGVLDLGGIIAASTIRDPGAEERGGDDGAKEGATSATGRRGAWTGGRIAAFREDLLGADPLRVERWGFAVKGMYRLMDEVLGDFMALMDAETVLLVVSDHGFQFGENKPPFDSSFNSGRGGASYHHHDGVLGAIGKGVRRGTVVLPYRPSIAGEAGGGAAASPAQGARIVDIAPTVLALQGFPKAADMPGRVLAELFEIDLATGRVATYETGRSEFLARDRVQRELARRRDPDNEEKERAARQIEDLVGIPYIGGSQEGDFRKYTHMAQSLVEQGRLEEAEEALGEAMKGADGGRRREVLIRRGSLRLRLRRTDDAARDFEQAAEGAEGRERLAALLGRATCLMSGSRPDEAIAAFEAVIAAAPGDDPSALGTRASAQMHLADALRERAAKRPGTDAARADLERGLALVESVLSEIRAKDADAFLNPGGRNIHGKILLDIGRFDEAMAEFRAAADADPNYAVPRNNLGVTYMRLANEDLLAAHRETDAGRQRELLARMRGKADEALRWFDAVLRINPDHHRARYNRAEILVRFPPLDLEAAAGELRHALRLRPDYARAKALLAEVENALRETAAVGTGTPR